MRPNKIRRWTIVCIELLVGIEKKGQSPSIKLHPVAVLKGTVFYLNET
ncbi:MAG: hypothetical protein J6U64_03620 [Alphaproteobacteria bacterium]|nr:hypothetical protein [Alphaproteobacteria bacterium]